MKMCNYKGCHSESISRGYCGHHCYILKKKGVLKNAYGKPIKERIMSKVKFEENGCWTYLGTPNKRYGELCVGSRKKTVIIYTHRYMLEQKLGRPIKEGYCACHFCDNSKCVNPEHLWEGTQYENVQDCIKKGRRGDFSGENCGTAVLTNKLARFIRNLYNKYKDKDCDITYKTIASELNLSERVVWSITRNKTYKNA